MLSLNSELERDELWLSWTSASQISCYLTKIECKGCIRYDLNNISNLLKKRLEEERLPLGSGIMRNSFCPASQYFSELHRMLIESLEDYYDQNKQLMLVLLPSACIHSPWWNLASFTISRTPVTVLRWGLCGSQSWRLAWSFSRLFFASESPVPTLVSFFILHQEGASLSWHSRQRDEKHIRG